MNKKRLYKVLIIMGSALVLCVAYFWIDHVSQTHFFSNWKFKPNDTPSDTVLPKNQRISPYDKLIKTQAKRLNWDWRLLASLIEQESHFNSRVVSRKGAIGLMQLMPDIAEKYGVTLESPPEAQIAAGVKYLCEIDKILPQEIPKYQRILFVLASYNAGVGRVLEIRELAEKHGKNPNVWFNSVEIELLVKSNPHIPRDSIALKNNLNAGETYNFVREILERWWHYRVD